MNTPLEQFLIKPIIRINNSWIDISITNSTIYLMISIILLITIINIGVKKNKIIKSRWGYLIELLYSKIELIIKEMIPGEYKRYIPLTIIIFLFILINNLIGVIPYSFTTTAHFIMTLTMSISIMVGVTIIGIVKHKLNFFKLFIPNSSSFNKGKIKLILPLIFFIEIISYLIRVISLAVRLTANLMSGHTLIKIIANYGLLYTYKIPILIILPLSLLSMVYILEIGVAIIQAYVFTLLTITYIKDTESLH